MNKRMDKDIITIDNVENMGLRIAKCAARAYARISGNNKMHKLYAGLCKDSMHMGDISYILSDGYDLAQEAICFLLEHLGESLSDKTCKGCRGDVITVKQACYRHIGNYLQRGARTENKRLSLEAFEYDEPFTEDIVYSDVDEQEQEVDNIIERMNLSVEEKETLLCYMAGMGYVEIAKYLSVQLTTIWYRRQRIQRKYNGLTR